MLYYSIGELIDKLVIENIKIFRLREKIHDQSLTKEERVSANQKMMDLNNNRTMLIKSIDDLADNLASGKKLSKRMKIIRTYGK